MTNHQENIVPSVNQNPTDFFALKKDTGPCFLFVGNSISRHGPRPEIGWYRDCGMAASCPEKDYVHLLMKRIEDVCPRASFYLLQVANYERLCGDTTPQLLFGEEPPVCPDVVFMFFGANVPSLYDHDQSRQMAFGKAYENLRNYLNVTGTVRFFHAQGFYKRPLLDEEKEKISHQYGDTFIDIEDIRQCEKNYGEFNHPNDTGMAAIAERFWSAAEPIVRRIASMDSQG